MAAINYDPNKLYLNENATNNLQKKLGNTSKRQRRFNIVGTKDSNGTFTNNKYVVKFFGSKNERNKEAAQLNNINSLDCPGIQKKTMTSNGNSYLLYTPYTGIDLITFLNTYTYTLQHAFIIQTINYILSSISCLHKKGVFHLDLKPENITINLKTWTTTIIDLETVQPGTTINGKSYKECSMTKRASYGTQGYRLKSVEKQLSNNAYNDNAPITFSCFQADLYALGTIFYMLLKYGSNHPLMNKIYLSIYENNKSKTNIPKTNTQSSYPYIQQCITILNKMGSIDNNGLYKNITDVISDINALVEYPKESIEESTEVYKNLAGGTRHPKKRTRTQKTKTRR